MKKLLLMTLSTTIKFLAIPGDGVKLDLNGIKVQEPAFGVDAVWIEPELDKDAQSKGYVTIDPTSVLIHTLVKFS